MLRLPEDVPPLAPYIAPHRFREARWFTRGWCLQELIAPGKLEFYASGWSDMGTKFSLCQQLEEMTGIPRDALLGRKPLSEYNAAEKMSWASGRSTTRIEDEAYCLLGIFGINMPLLYGEGRCAFQRLQEQILSKTGDYSVLVWTGWLPEDENYNLHGIGRGVLAKSPKQFPPPPDYILDYSQMRQDVPEGAEWEPPLMTARGLRVNLMFRQSEVPKIYKVWTGLMSVNEKYICLGLWPTKITGFRVFGRNTYPGLGDLVLAYGDEFAEFELATIYLKPETGDISHISKPMMLYIPLDIFDIRVNIIRHGYISILPDHLLMNGLELQCNRRTYNNSTGEPLYVTKDIRVGIPAAQQPPKVQFVTVTVAVAGSSKKVGIFFDPAKSPITPFKAGAMSRFNVTDRDVCNLPDGGGGFYLALKDHADNPKLDDCDPRHHRFPRKGVYNLHITSIPSTDLAGNLDTQSAV